MALQGPALSANRGKIDFMITVVLTIHVLIVLALIGVVLIQRSDGSALGLGGGGGGGGFMSGAGATDALTRTTTVLAAAFFLTSFFLAKFAAPPETTQDLIEELTGETVRDPGDPLSADDLLRTLGGSDASEAVEDAAADLDATAQEIIDDAGEAAEAVEDAVEDATSAPEPAEDDDGQ